MLKINSDNSGNNNSALLEKQSSKLKQKSPKYKVLLHNDPVNSMEYVTSTLREVVPQLSEQDAISMIINGFVKDVLKELPLEFAVEANKLLDIKLEGSVG